MKILVLILLSASICLMSCDNGHSKYKIQNSPEFGPSYYDAALKAIEESLNNNPNNAEAHYKKAVYLSKLNKDVEAIASIERALELKQSNPEYYLVATQAYLKLKDHNKAMHAAKQAEKAGLNNAWLYSSLAAISREKGDSIQAIEYINKAILADPQNPVHYYDKGNIFLSLGDSVSAIETFNNSLHIDSSNFDIITALTDIYLAQKKYPLAKAVLEKKLKLYDADLKTQFQTGILLSKIGLLDSAKVSFSKIIEKDSTNSKAYYHLGQVYFQKLRYDSAQFFAEKAIRVNSKEKEALLMLARIKDRQRQYYNALVAYDNLIKLDTTFSIAFKERANIQKKINNLAKVKQEERTPILPTIQPKF